MEHENRLSAMKKYYLLPALVLSLTACQAPISKPTVEPNTIINEENIVNNLCQDGTLDCIPEVSGNVYTSTDAFLLGMYNDCLLAAAANAQCSGVPASNPLPVTLLPQDLSELSGMTFQDINSAAASSISCPGAGTIASYQAQCHENVYGQEAELWSSDRLEWPENAMVVEMTLRTCIDGKNQTAMQFAGPTANLNNYYRAERILCGQGGIENKTKVEFKPFTESTYVLNGQSFSTTPFPTSEEITKKHRGWEVTPFGVPSTYTKHMNVGQGRWLVRKVMADFGNIDITNDDFLIKTEYVSEARDLGYPLTNIFFKKWGQALSGGAPTPQGVEIIMLFVAPKAK